MNQGLRVSYPFKNKLYVSWQFSQTLWIKSTIVNIIYGLLVLDGCKWDPFTATYSEALNNYANCVIFNLQ